MAHKTQKQLFFLFCTIFLISINGISALICYGEGGIITEAGNYCIHTFLNNGTFNISENIDAEILVVGGGGGGGQLGGGGGGGVVYNLSFPLIDNTQYNVIVGTGGEHIGFETSGVNGLNSSFGDIMIGVGGGGGGYGVNGLDGGSGGGASATLIGGNSTQGNYSGIGYGNKGGDFGTTGFLQTTGGSGGGAGGVGHNGGLTGDGIGGEALIFNISGNDVGYGGGGGSGGTDALGGTNGSSGGKGGDVTNTYPATNGVANTGGGGGGGGIGTDYWVAGNGSSGIVIIRYLGEIDTTPPNINLISPSNNSKVNYTSINFTYNLSDASGLANTTLYIYNETGLYNSTFVPLANETTKEVNIMVELINGIFNWFIDVFDIFGNSNTSENYTIQVNTTPIIYDTTFPLISIVSPLNQTYNEVVTELNYSVSDETGLDSCWYSTDFGVTNNTITCGDNVTGLTSSLGRNYWEVWASDTSGNTNSSSVEFYYMVNATIGMGISNLYDDRGINPFYYVSVSPANYLFYNRIIADFVETNNYDDDCVYNIYVNDVYISNGNQLDLILASQVGAGIYNVTYETTGCANYSAGSVTTTFQTYNRIYSGTMWGNTLSVPTWIGLSGSIPYDSGIGAILLSEFEPIPLATPDAISGNGLVAFEYLNNSGSNVGYNKVRIYNTTYGVEASGEVEWTISPADPTFDGYLIGGATMFLTIPSNQDYNGSSLNIVANEIIPLDKTGCVFDLWINGIIVDSGSSISYDYVFDAGTYDVNYSAYGCMNYYNNSLYQQFTINKATPSLSLIADSILVNQGDNNNVSASYTMPENISDCEFNFYRNGILINSSLGSNSGFSENTKSFFSGHYDYVYNVTGCTNYNYAQQTLGIDILSVAYHEIRIYNPLPISYNYLISELNFSITNTLPLDSCWYSLDNGETNITTDCSLNITGLTSIQGTNTWIIWANDSFNQINTSSVTFIVDTINPEIYLISPSDNFETYNTTLNYTYYVDDATSGVKNTTLYVFDENDDLIHKEVSYSSGSKRKSFALPYGNYTWYADVWDNLDNFNSTETRYLSIIQEPEVEVEQTTRFTEQGQIIYGAISGAGAGLGIFMNFMGQALPVLLFGLLFVGIIVVIGYSIFSFFKHWGVSHRTDY